MIDACDSAYPISCAKVSVLRNNFQAVKSCHRVGGDFLNGDGTGSFSIYGKNFPVCVFMFFMLRVHELILYRRTRTSKKSIPDLAYSLWFATISSSFTKGISLIVILGEFRPKYKWMPGMTSRAFACLPWAQFL